MRLAEETPLWALDQFTACDFWHEADALERIGVPKAYDWHGCLRSPYQVVKRNFCFPWPKGETRSFADNYITMGLAVTTHDTVEESIENAGEESLSQLM